MPCQTALSTMYADKCILGRKAVVPRIMREMHLPSRFLAASSKIRPQILLGLRVPSHVLPIPDDILAGNPQHAAYLEAVVLHVQFRLTKRISTGRQA